MTPQYDIDELAGEYVLGTLPLEARRAVEQALAHDAGLRAAVGYWEQRLLPLSNLVEPAPPPAALWSRIERSLAPAPRPATRQAPAPRWWAGLRWWRGLATGAIAAAVVLAALLGKNMFTAAHAHYLVVLAAPQDAVPGWMIRLDDDDDDPGGGALRLAPLAGAGVPDGRALQLWTKADGWSGPVSLGLVKPGAETRVDLHTLPHVVPNQLFEITLEPAAGSPAGRPTGPVLFIGRAVKTL